MLPKPRMTDELEQSENTEICRPSPRYLNYSSYVRNIFLYLTKKVQQGRSSADSSKLDSELVVENKFPHSCPECSRSFKTKKGLSQHKGKIHCEEIKWKSCYYCGKKFKHKYAVRFHISQVHKKATRTECPQCNNYFYNKYELKKHLLKIHKNDNIN